MGFRLEMRKVELTAALKKDMLERGMSPQDIRTVLEAGQKSANELRKPPAYSEV